MPELNENGQKVEAVLNEKGLSLRNAGLSIGSFIELGLIDPQPKLTAGVFRAILEPKTRNSRPA